MIITHSYKWDTPKLQQQQPKLLQLTPIQAADELYKIKQINVMLMSSFQVNKKCIIYLAQFCYLITPYLIFLTIYFLVNLKGGTTYSCIAQITAIVSLIKWYYKA
jgi:hypothetical protein